VELDVAVVAMDFECGMAVKLVLESAGRVGRFKLKSELLHSLRSGFAVLKFILLTPHHHSHSAISEFIPLLFCDCPIPIPLNATDYTTLYSGEALSRPLRDATHR